MVRKIKAKLVLRLRADGLSSRQIEAEGMSRHSVIAVLEAADREGVSWDDVAELDDAVVYAWLLPGGGEHGSVHAQPDWKQVHRGARKIAKTYAARLRFPAPATVETWISDGRGDPVLVVMAEPAASLAGELRRLLPTLREAVGDDRRVLVGFGRGGWSPTLFKHMFDNGFDPLTWRKQPAPDTDPALFTKVGFTDDTGLVHTWQAADTMVEVPVDDHGVTISMRQVTRLIDTKTGTRQAHILTTRSDLPAGEILYRMGSRWRQENYFRYARMHFALDAHDSYHHTSDDPDRMVRNPRGHARGAAGRQDLINVMACR